MQQRVARSPDGILAGAGVSVMESGSAEPVSTEPPSSEHILLVGQDIRGRWMVQENHGLIEGIFISRDAAVHFAYCERHAFPGGRVEIADVPLASTLAN
jgi:hypothetical protein